MFEEMIKVYARIVTFTIATINIQEEEDGDPDVLTTYVVFKLWNSIFSSGLFGRVTTFEEVDAILKTVPPKKFI